MTPYDRVVAALKDRRSRRHGDNWQCPAHDDNTPSLSVDTGTDRETGEPTVLIYCHAGCSTTTEILPALGIDPSELYTRGLRAGVQGELFPASQYSPVGLDVLRKLPPGAERSFIVASALGRYVTSTGSRARVYGQRQIAAVILERKHRIAVEKTLGMKANQLRNDIVKWESWNVAHKCDRNVLTILVRVVTACPVCRTPLADGVWLEKAPLADGVRGVATPLADGAFERETAITEGGFSKGVTAEPPDHEVDPPHQQVQEIARRRKFEVYPELKALEEARRREDQRKAAGE